MRKILLSLTVLGGLTGAGLAPAAAAPATPRIGADAPALVHTVQYYGGYGRGDYGHDRGRWHHHWHPHYWHHWHQGY